MAKQPNVDRGNRGELIRIMLHVRWMLELQDIPLKPPSKQILKHIRNEQKEKDLVELQGILIETIRSIVTLTSCTGSESLITSASTVDEDETPQWLLDLFENAREVTNNHPDYQPRPEFKAKLLKRLLEIYDENRK